MGVSQAIVFLAVLVAVVIALPQHQFFGQVHSAQQQPGNYYAVPASHNSGYRQLAPVVPVGPVSAPFALQPSKPMATFPMEHDLEGSIKPAEMMVVPVPSDARNPDFSALLDKLTGAVVIQTVTSTHYYPTSTYTVTSTLTI